MTLDKALKGIDFHIWTSEGEVGELLASLIKMSQFKNTLESGVFKGQTGCYMIDALPEDGVYYGVDIEDHRADSVKEFMSNQKFILGSSLEKLPKLPNRFFDLIFIDSVHELDYLREEFKICERLIRQDGIIVLHDAYLPGVTKWIEYIKTIDWFEVLVLDTKDSIGQNRGIAIVKCLMA